MLLYHRHLSDKVAATRWQRQGGSDKVAATRWQRQGGSDKVAATRWQRQDGSDKVAATRWQRQGGGDKVAATRWRRQGVNTLPLPKNVPQKNDDSGKLLFCYKLALFNSSINAPSL